MKKPNRNIAVNFELDENGRIVAIRSNQCNDLYLTALITCASNDINCGLILRDADIQPENCGIDPAGGDRFVKAAEYIISRGHFENLPDEN